MKQEQKRDANGRFVKTSRSKEDLQQEINALKHEVGSIHKDLEEKKKELYLEKQKSTIIWNAYQRQYDRALDMLNCATPISRWIFRRGLPKTDEEFFYLEGKVIPIV